MQQHRAYLAILLASRLLSRRRCLHECIERYRHRAVGFERSVALCATLRLSSDFFVARRMKVPLYELLGGLVRNKCQVYCWIGGDRPSDIESAAYVDSAF